MPPPSRTSVLPLFGRIPDDSQPRLELLPRGRDVPVEGKPGLPMNGAKNTWPGGVIGSARSARPSAVRSSRSDSDGSATCPARTAPAPVARWSACRHRSVLLPFTPANCRNSSSGPVIVVPAGQTSVVVGRAVRALHELRPDVHIVHEALHAVEDVAAVGEADEGLRGGGAVDLGAELEVVRAANQRQVVVDLEARVVILRRE